MLKQNHPLFRVKKLYFRFLNNSSTVPFLYLPYSLDTLSPASPKHSSFIQALYEFTPFSLSPIKALLRFSHSRISLISEILLHFADTWIHLFYKLSLLPPIFSLSFSQFSPCLPYFYFTTPPILISCLCTGSFLRSFSHIALNSRLKLSFKNLKYVLNSEWNFVTKMIESMIIKVIYPYSKGLVQALAIPEQQLIILRILSFSNLEKTPTIWWYPT